MANDALTDPETGAQAARWDARYASAPGGLFGDAPSDWLRMALARSDAPSGRALALADGDGRNGSWLAARGFAVTAVDLSTEATARAAARDRAAGVAVDRITADLSVWAPPLGRRWDLAAILHLHGSRALRLRALRLAAEALAPGGALLLEGFATAQAGAAMGPDDPDKLWDLEEALAETADLAQIEALTGRVRLDEGPRHAGLAAVVRLLARRPS